MDLSTEQKEFQGFQLCCLVKDSIPPPSLQTINPLIFHVAFDKRTPPKATGYLSFPMERGMDGGEGAPVLFGFPHETRTGVASRQ